MTEQATASTQVITAGELPRPVSQALAAFAERHGIAGLVAGAAMTVRTVMPGVMRRRLARATAPAVSYAMLSPGLLVVVTTSAGVTVTAWHLAGAEARRITDSPGGVLITGLQLTAFRLGGAERQTIFISLAADHDGSAFETAGPRHALAQPEQCRSNTRLTEPVHVPAQLGDVVVGVFGVAGGY